MNNRTLYRETIKTAQNGMKYAVIRKFNTYYVCESSDVSTNDKIATESFKETNFRAETFEKCRAYISSKLKTIAETINRNKNLILSEAAPFDDETMNKNVSNPIKPSIDTPSSPSSNEPSSLSNPTPSTNISGAGELQSNQPQSNPSSTPMPSIPEPDALGGDSSTSSDMSMGADSSIGADAEMGTDAGSTDMTSASSESEEAVPASQYSAKVFQDVQSGLVTINNSDDAKTLVSNFANSIKHVMDGTQTEEDRQHMVSTLKDLLSEYENGASAASIPSSPSQSPTQAPQNPIPSEGYKYEDMIVSESNGQQKRLTVIRQVKESAVPKNKQQEDRIREIMEKSNAIRKILGK